MISRHLVEVLGQGPFERSSQVGRWEQHLGDKFEAKSAHGFIASPDFAQSDVLQRLLKDSLLLSFHAAKPRSGNQTLLLSPVSLCPLSLPQQKPTHQVLRSQVGQLQG